MRIEITYKKDIEPIPEKSIIKRILKLFVSTPAVRISIEGEAETCKKILEVIKEMIVF